MELTSKTVYNPAPINFTNHIYTSKCYVCQFIETFPRISLIFIAITFTIRNIIFPIVLNTQPRYVTGTAYLPVQSTEFTPGFKWGSCYSIFNFMCMFCLSSCSFSFGHCVVYSSSIYGFLLRLWYLQALLQNY